MVSPSFHERFRDKISTMNRNGVLDLEVRQPISPSPLKVTANSMLKQPIKVSQSLQQTQRADNRFSSPLIQRHGRNSAQHKQRLRPRPQLMSAQPHKKDHWGKKRNDPMYTPYSLTEYRNIANQNYYCLGGLGPSNVGTLEWTEEERKRRRRRAYSNQFQQHSEYSFSTERRHIKL